MSWSNVISSVSNTVGSVVSAQSGKPNRKTVTLVREDRKNALYEGLLKREIKSSAQKANESQAVATAENSKRVITYIIAGFGGLIVLVLFAFLLKNKKR